MGIDHKKSLSRGCERRTRDIGYNGHSLAIDVLQALRRRALGVYEVWHQGVVNRCDIFLFGALGSLLIDEIGIYSIFFGQATGKWVFDGFF